MAEERTHHFDQNQSIYNSRGGKTLHFIDRKNRDAVAKLIKGLGENVQLSTSRGQRLHPEYIEDYEGSYETGFGNQDYLRMWKVLYNLQVRGD